MAYSAGQRAGAYALGIAGLAAATGLLKVGMGAYEAIALAPEDRVNRRVNEAQYYFKQQMFDKMLRALAAAETISHNRGVPVPAQRIEELQAQTMAYLTDSETFPLQAAKNYLRAAQVLSAQGKLPHHTRINELETLVRIGEGRREHRHKEMEEHRAQHPEIYGDS